jgi:hypothetical protein
MTKAEIFDPDYAAGSDLNRRCVRRLVLFLCITKTFQLAEVVYSAGTASSTTYLDERGACCSTWG